MTHTCPDCGRGFDTKRGLGIHEGSSHTPDDPPWRDAETLRRLYHDEELNQYEIAEELDCQAATVCKWMERLDIESRGQSEAQRLRHGTDAPVSLKWHRDGYLTSYFNHENTYYEVRIHRLAAVAWHGFDAVAGNDVHHENGHKADNREENLEPLSPEEHMALHVADAPRASGGELKPVGATDELQGGADDGE